MSAPSPAIEFLDEVTSDLVFVARADSREQVFAVAAEALLSAMVENPDAVAARFEHDIALAEPDDELLLLAFLNELIYLRDARGWLLRVKSLELDHLGGGARLRARLEGEPCDPGRHHFAADIKAATAHGLSLREVDGHWEARVTVDV